MMWNWLTQKLTKKQQITRRKVNIDIPYQLHTYRREDVKLKSANTAVKIKSNHMSN
ncbi:hypothetical protein [Shewanella fidelis]|uniref:Uncharacterized protein n=1 Tax=Shewanella fidelis TaxID=173509 RepID=A0AAW8NPB2_9GAMM|nr:hypothetical protein [Shewanella fidelis]MDR8524361.1 hypothetical protein [Shewanella fidelis]MDW4813430.1 hypothetical protein [Shewanella fidelis]MDW4817647.1 hypothetical protein [Shewanella fidelis]MDW4821714.1 hypothetical protein [Shewanella fidelis]MDW4825879.1 hypothetical protein [Shewanella fidelis]